MSSVPPSAPPMDPSAPVPYKTSWYDSTPIPVKAPPPQLSAAIPSIDVIAGMPMNITGVSLSSTYSVTMDGLPCTNVIAVNNGRVTCIAPMALDAPGAQIPIIAYTQLGASTTLYVTGG